MGRTSGTLALTLTLTLTLARSTSGASVHTTPVPPIHGNQARQTVGLAAHSSEGTPLVRVKVRVRARVRFGFGFGLVSVSASG